MSQLLPEIGEAIRDAGSGSASGAGMAAGSTLPGRIGLGFGTLDKVSSIPTFLRLGNLPIEYTGCLVALLINISAEGSVTTKKVVEAI
jgi:hypothetical protein